MPPWNAVNRLQTSHNSAHPHNAAASTSKSFPAPALPHTPDPTPPSSLPTSVPNSPEYVEADLKGRHHRGGSMDRVGHGGPAKPGRASRSPQKRRAVAAVEYIDSFDEFSDPPEPALSAAHDPVGFPSFRTNGWTQRFPSSDAEDDSVRFGSTTKKTTITTTTTLRTERRIRYSFPSALHPHEETHSDGSTPRPRTRSHTGRPHVSFAPSFTRSSSTGSSRTRSPSGFHRRSGGTAGARQSRRSLGASEYSPHRISSNAFPRSSSAPFLHAPPATPATSSPFFRRSSLASASSFAVERRTTMRERDDSAEHAIAKALSDSTLPFFRPVFQSLAFFVVSAIAAITVSAVLVTSFSLTFYDDCSRRVGDVQRSLGGSIEGVRAGMGRMIGNAKGALDLAVKAAGANRSMAGRHDASHGDERGRTAMPTVEEQPDSDGEPVKRRKSRRKMRSSATEPSVASGWAFKASPPPPAPLGRPGSHEEGELADAAGWGTDDDALPFDVPHPTPRHSRPASPHRSRQASGTASASTLPPRPPLAFLIPSILFALVFAFARVVGEIWKGKNAGSHGPSRPSWQGARA
ncbi:hypothetical protein RTBOTA2_005181 [Rhodotorula toruloides]|uniref:Uncharacterized protein n=2 Tax=Rhodotorula toruloides TaxID=5286 RepID=A0A2T0A8D3_RHOTO|nr:hypothetical protein RTBOTA2_005181 [Rhodotorula toruloides]PRQ74265.1 hypothetical protein AAT19DRAFT_14618 [Rhodotorula toruloides]